MTEWPKTNKAMIIEHGVAEIAFEIGRRLRTCILREGRYVRIDDGRHYPQLCKHAALLGDTLIYHSDEQLARDCEARLYRTRAGFERAAERLRKRVPDWYEQTGEQHEQKSTTR